jgi:putative hydrolase of the HAD superfamily
MEHEDSRLMAHDDRCKVILFDLGGVLLKLNDPIETFGLQIDQDEFKERWLRSPSVRKFESGGMNNEEFARNIVAEAELPYDWQEFLQRFDSWPDQLFDQTLSVLRAIPAKFDRALLSNINALHWGRDNIAGQLVGCFDHSFLSYETGLIKPDREAFELVVNTYNCQPGEILFFDDSPLNVSAAANYGMQAVLAMGIGDVSAVLRERGVLSQAR